VAFEAGHHGALFDELNASLHAAERTNQRRPEDMPILPGGTLDARTQPDDPVVVPHWAFKAVYQLASMQMIQPGRGRKGGRHAR
jgi:hypothetical protein